MILTDPAKSLLSGIKPTKPKIFEGKDDSVMVKEENTKIDADNLKIDADNLKIKKDIKTERLKEWKRPSNKTDRDKSRDERKADWEAQNGVVKQ